MDKKPNVSNFESLFNYFTKIQRLNTLFKNNNISNKAEYQKQVEDIEEEVRKIIGAGGENSINFNEFNQRLDDIISHVDKESKEYETRKQNALMEVLSKNDELLKEKQDLDSKREEQSAIVRNLRLNLVKLVSIIGALTLFPVGMGAIGVVLGRVLGTEYKMTEVTYNAKTHKTIKDPQVTYQNLSHTYKVIVKECSPWVKGEYSDGYTREVLEYSYGSEEEINIDKVLKTVTPKSYIETKKTLDSEDSTEQKEVIVTEYTNDKSDYRIAPQSVAVLGIGLFLFASLLPAFTVGNYFWDLIDRIKELREAKLTIKEIKESYEQIGDKVVLLQTEFKKDPDEYLELLDSIDPELLKTADKFSK